MSDAETGGRPLTGLEVVEMGGAGPMFLGRMLRDLGAKVARLERRTLRECDPQADVASFGVVCNHGKLAIGDGDLEQCVAHADVVVRDADGPIAISAAWQQWSAINPTLILVSITPFGAEGPFAGRPSSDLVATAMSGYLNPTGPAGGPPVKPSVPFLAERHAAAHALAALQLALRRRRLRGVGSHVDVAVRDASMWMLVSAYQHWDLARVNVSRRGSNYSIGDLTRVMPSLFRCRDGFVVWIPLAGRLAGATARLVEVMRREGMAPKWLQELDWDEFELRTAEQIKRFLTPFETYFLSRSSAQLLELGLTHGCMLAPVVPMQQTLDDPQLDAQGMWSTQRLMSASVRLPRAPVRFSGLDWSPPAPVDR